MIILATREDPSEHSDEDFDAFVFGNCVSLEARSVHKAHVTNKPLN